MLRRLAGEPPGEGSPMPKVAIAMAVFDDARYLALALDALCAQTFRDFHLTVHDDGSTDGSAALAESYAGRLPIAVVRGEHRGRHHAKQASWAAAAPSPYLMVLDSDVAPPPDAIRRMVERLDADPAVAAVSARTIAHRGRPLGPSQGFLERFFFEVNGGAAEEGRWIAGNCTMLRRSAIAGLEVRADLGEDNDLSEKLRGRWRLLAPPDLVADHYGVPTTLGGVLRRFDREGVRVRSLVRVYPGARQLGNVARLVPLPLCAVALAGALLRQGWLVAACGAALAAYLGAFLAASRKVPARFRERLGGAALFTFGNLGFGVGWCREALRGRTSLMREPARRF